jgi:uncharacterized protein GlcG (DUF336 family)
MTQEVNFIALQAVNNAVQHAQAEQIRVAMSVVDSCLRIVVADTAWVLILIRSHPIGVYTICASAPLNWVAL